MANAYQYTALICSLPVCEDLFAASNTPISRFQLQQRLSELEPEDRHDIQKLSDILDWFQQPKDRSDEQLLALFQRHIQTIHSEDIRSMLRWRMTFRSVIGALRRRHQGQPLPTAPWAYGRWVPMMRKNWHEPTLGLDKRLPWVVDAVHCLKEERAMDLERLLLQQVWQWLERLSWQHQFDLAAVAIYRMRWDLISRWVRYSREPAQKRFAAMVQQAIAPVNVMANQFK